MLFVLERNKHRLCTQIVVAAVLAFATGCSTIPTNSSYSAVTGDQVAKRFYRAIEASEFIENPSRALWLLTVHVGHQGGSAWLGEVREGALHVAHVDLLADSDRLQVISTMIYPNFSDARKAAIESAFSTYGGIAFGSDFWVGGAEVFVGNGRQFTRSVRLIADSDRELLASWLIDPSPGQRDIFEDVPVELLVPWIMTRCYPPD